MISQLRGILAVKQPPLLVIDVNGVGYELQASMTTIYALANVGAEVFVYTHFVVREDAQLLYGFANEKERMLFREIIKVSGVGPKLALSILSGMDISGLAQAIADRDSTRLVKIPGVGKKTAERIIVELADRLQKLFANSGQEFSAVLLTGNDVNVTTNAEQDAISALQALGYKPAEATKAVNRAIANSDSQLDSEGLIKLALQEMIR